MYVNRLCRPDASGYYLVWEVYLDPFPYGKMYGVEQCWMVPGTVEAGDSDA